MSRNPKNSGLSQQEWAQVNKRCQERIMRMRNARSAYRNSPNPSERNAVLYAEGGHGYQKIVAATGVSEEFARRITGA